MVKKDYIQKLRCISNMTYFDKCDIYREVDVVLENSKITKKDTILIYKDIPTRLSYKNSTSNYRTGSTSFTDTYNFETKTAKFFMDIDVDIKVADKIIIKKEEGTYEYEVNGVPNIYLSHIEVFAKLVCKDEVEYDK